ncbi:MAG: methyltransferase domain-containing protein [Verrucomicrobia bacterium]|nr:methyltransferase domain-containing protein [Verrucomicrobiota bacterium]MCH8510298.1 acetylserotonin O-methyltransferase [Kiritimatiellia bacterium]
MHNPVDLVDLASRYWQSAALNAAVSLGIFDLLATGAASAEDLAEKLDCSVLHLQALLDSLCGLEVLGKAGNQYRIPDDLQPLLDPASPDSLLAALKFNGDLFALWMRLPDCVRTGKPALPDNPHLGKDPERMKRFVEGMHSRAGIMARGVLPYLVFPENTRWLDVGGGPGTFSLKLLEQDESFRATVLDLPPVVAAAADIHAGKAALDRLTFQGGDYHTAEFPSDQDVVLYCGALHQEPEEDIHALFRKMCAALKPGGHLYVIDLMLDPDRTTPVYSALFQINMMLMRPTSRVYTVERLEALLNETGFTDCYTQHIEGTPYTMVRATPER